MDLQGLLLTNYIREIVNGLEAKRELIRIAKKNPAQVLTSFKQLPAADQRSFHWVRQIAASSLERQASRG